MSMSPEPGFLTAMVVEFTADTILSALLIFLWLMQRKEKHALFWGGGQLAIMAGGLIWFGGVGILPLQWRLYLSALFLSAGMAGYWSGTQFFIGKLRAAHVRWMAPVTLLASAVFYFLWSNHQEWLPRGSAGALGLLLLWTGVRLVNVNNRYRFLGLTLLLRGGFNLFSVVSLDTDTYVVWFIGTSML